MTRSRDHGATEAARLTEQDFDEALAANQGLMMVDFWERRQHNGHSRTRRAPPRPAPLPGTGPRESPPAHPLIQQALERLYALAHQKGLIPQIPPLDPI